MKRLDRLTGRTILITLVVLMLLSSAVMPVSAHLNFRVVSEESIPDRDLLIEERVSLVVVLKEVTPALITETLLLLDTELDEPIWTIMVNGKIVDTRDVRKFNFTFDHFEYDTVTIKLDGRAPTVGVRTSTAIMDIRQMHIGLVGPKAGDIDDMHQIRVNVTSELIEYALATIFGAMDQITRAKKAIADAEGAGVDVTGAIAYLQTARNFNNSSNALYHAAQINESIAAADSAHASAVRAQRSAEAAVVAHVLWANITTIGIVLAIIIIALVVYSKRRWGRL